jgi:hypothetical protein
MSGPAFGQAGPSADSNDYNAMQFLIMATIAKMQTVSVVEVVAVHGGGVAPTGTVDVKVLINLMTGNGQPVPHGIIYGVPFNRAQGGLSAIILDPVVGDVGMAAFASRDISSVKAARGQANPSSARQFDWADAIYVSGMLNAAPTNYIQIDDTDGVKIVSPVKVYISAPIVEVDASTSATVNSPAVTIGTATTIDGVLFLTHTHSGVTTGGGVTGPVVP